jgi:hypothetical protein
VGIAHRTSPGDTETPGTRWQSSASHQISGLYVYGGAVIFLGILVSSDFATSWQNVLWAALGSVLREWARSWNGHFVARPVIIRQAIRTIKPVPEDTDLSPLARVDKSRIASPSNNLLAAIASLSAFERLVFGMSILERLSDGDCLGLLRYSRRELDLAVSWP